MKSYFFSYRIKGTGATVQETIRADNAYVARKLLEAKFTSWKDIQITTVTDGRFPVTNLLRESESLPIGTRVAKVSGKPFKSSLKVNTIAGHITHPITGRSSYSFVEDDTVVEAKQCTHELPAA
jgi:hypothetical protein